MEVLDTPKTITTNITIASFKIQCAVVVLNTTANVNVTLFNASGDNVGYKSFILNITVFLPKKQHQLECLYTEPSIIHPITHNKKSMIFVLVQLYHLMKFLTSYVILSFLTT